MNFKYEHVLTRNDASSAITVIHHAFNKARDAYI